MSQFNIHSLHCHTGSGVIIVQLNQPYYIGSLRLLLWDCDDRTYSFYIETSINQKDYEMAVDKQQEQLRSWQQFTFQPRPVVYIKIVGTYNTANEVCSQKLVHEKKIKDKPKLYTFRSFIAFILSVHHKTCQNNRLKHRLLISYLLHQTTQQHNHHHPHHQ